jgi:hypothetical protein
MITSSIFMVRPSNFGFNPETSESNLFQSKSNSSSPEEISEKAILEFDSLVEKLKAAGIEVVVFEDTKSPLKTDAVFPNNWITSHRDGKLILYPMFSKNRRLEVRKDIVEHLKKHFHFDQILDWTDYSNKNEFLEGTGSMILDRDYGYAYACRSIRTNDRLFHEFCEIESFKPILFNAQDLNNVPIYHTNVMMALGINFAIICLDAIIDKEERELVVNALGTSEKEIIEISKDQMHHFAGNMIQLQSKLNTTYLIMSSQAYDSLSEHQVKKVNSLTQIIHSPLETIEKYGGGSARCMIAEIFAPIP